MTWIQTYSGRRFSLTEPSAEDVDIDDVAHALSLLCRFTGHVPQLDQLPARDGDEGSTCRARRGAARLPRARGAVRLPVLGLLSDEDEGGE